MKIAAELNENSKPSENAVLNMVHLNVKLTMLLARIRIALEMCIFLKPNNNECCNYNFNKFTSSRTRTEYILK